MYPLFNSFRPIRLFRSAKRAASSERRDVFRCSAALNVRPRWLVIILVLFAAALVPLSTQAQQIQAFVSTDSVTVGERFYLSLVAEYDSSDAPSFPNVTTDSTFGDLVIIGRNESFTTRTTQAGTRVDSAVYEVTTFALDTAFVPAIPVSFTSGTTVSSQPMIVGVRSLVEEDAQDIRDLAPLVAFPRALWPWVLLFLLAALVVAALVWYARKKQRAPAPVPESVEPIPEPVSPYDEAMERLRELEGTDLYDPGAIKPFYVELTDILRTYLERRLQVPALEMTTRELLFALHRLGEELRPDPRTVASMQSVLDLSDLVKFAELQPDAGQGKQAHTETQNIIETIESGFRTRLVGRDHPADSIVAG